MKILLFLISFAIIFRVRAQNNTAKDTNTYFIKARLIDTISLSPHCGIFAWAIAQKFELIKSEIPEYKSGVLILMEPCPEFHGKDFF